MYESGCFVYFSAIHRRQRNILEKKSLSGLNILRYKSKGFIYKIYLSQEFNLRQSLLKTSTREQNTFDGFSPVYSAGMGMEYTFSKVFELFAKARCMGGDIIDKGCDDFQFRQVIVH